MSDPQSHEDSPEQPLDEQAELNLEEPAAQNDSEPDLPDTEASDDQGGDDQNGGSHWKSLVEEIGVQVAPTAASASQPQSAPVESSKPTPKKEQAKPRTSAPAPGRQHWAGLAGELGIDFPDPPPEEPEEPEVAEAETAKEPEPQPTAEEAPARRQDRKEERGKIVPVAPDNLIEDTPAAVSDMLDEMEEPDFGGDIDESALDDAEEIEARVTVVDDDDDFVDAEVVEEIDDEDDEESSEKSEDESDEEERPRRRRGRRRGGRRRRRGSSERSDADESTDDDDDESARGDDRDDDTSIDDELPSRDEDEEEDDRPRRRSRSRGRGDRSSRSESSGEGSQKEYKFPMWSEAIDLLVTKNMEGRKSGGGRDSRSSRGGRGRGRRRSS